VKKSLNSDGYQFLQYQQNEQLPLILIEFTEHKQQPRPPSFLFAMLICSSTPFHKRLKLRQAMTMFCVIL
jgi:hypothetical protein